MTAGDEGKEREAARRIQGFIVEQTKVFYDGNSCTMVRTDFIPLNHTLKAIKWGSREMAEYQLLF